MVLLPIVAMLERMFMTNDPLRDIPGEPLTLCLQLLLAIACFLHSTSGIFNSWCLTKYLAINRLQGLIAWDVFEKGIQSVIIEFDVETCSVDFGYSVARGATLKSDNTLSCGVPLGRDYPLSTALRVPQPVALEWDSLYEGYRARSTIVTLVVDGSSTSYASQHLFAPVKPYGT